MTNMDTILIDFDNFNLTENFSDVIKSLKNDLFIYDKPLNAILISTYIPLFLIALTSNILIILVVSRYRCLRSVTNYFLVNLSIADLLVTVICMPAAVGQAVHQLWLYGSTMCRLTHYLQGVAVSASIFTITAMSIDRYLAIRHPMSRKIINRRTTRKVILCLWILSLVIFAPILLIRKISGYTIGTSVYNYCIEEWPDNISRKTFGTFCFIVVYAIPGFIVVLAYSLMGLRLCSRQLIPEYHLTHGPSSPNAAAAIDSANSTWQVSSAGGRLIRERRRVAKILLILALVFAICWLPYSVLSLILDLTAKTDKSLKMDQDSYYGILALSVDLLPFAILLGHVNSAVNPLLYCLLSKNFRRSVAEMIRHPTRAVRGTRQQCKIRMTFKKEGVAEKQSSKEQLSNNRPRNHHAPDPPIHSHSGGNGDTERPISNGAAVLPKAAPSLGPTLPTELCIIELKSSKIREHVVSYSPSSSGYSSLRHSTEISSSSKEFPTNVYAHSTLYPYFGTPLSTHLPTSYMLGGAIGESGGNLDKNCSCRGRVLVEFSVPSTICEESESSRENKGNELGIRNRTTLIR